LSVPHSSAPAGATALQATTAASKFVVRESGLSDLVMAILRTGQAD
jgi:hypothetical protein